MSQMMLIGNPSRRRKARKSRRSSRRGARKMSALQLKYFGKRRARRSSGSRRRSRRRVVVAQSNPIIRRRRARRSASSVRRRFRRNPIGGAQVRASIGSIGRVAKNAAIGAGGALAVDVLMGQASRFLPASMTARYDAKGAINWGYYLTKAGIAVGLGVVGAKVLPGSTLKSFAARATEGSFTIMAYEIGRSMIPPEVLALGFYSPARVAGLRGRVGAYLPRGAGNGGAGMGRLGYASPANVGGSLRNSEGYAL